MPLEIAKDCQNFKTKDDRSLCSFWNIYHDSPWPILAYADQEGRVKRKKLTCDPSCPQYIGPRNEFRAKVYKLVWNDDKIFEVKNWKLCHRCASYRHIDAPDLIISSPKDCPCHCHREAVVFKRVKD